MRTKLLVIVLVLSAGLPGVARAARDEPATPYPGGMWSPPEPTFGAVVEREVVVRMDDGAELVGDVAYPAAPDGSKAPGPFPVLLSQNPYRGAGVGPSGVEATAVPGEYFVQRGYIYAQIDVRGTSRSEGTQEPFGARQGRDGAALVHWAASLPGSNGDVGLHGCSYLGMVQLNTARFLGPDSPVKAMIPACASTGFYRDQMFDNGIPAPVFSVGYAGVALTGVRPDPTDMVTMNNLTWAELHTGAVTGGDNGYYRGFWVDTDRMRDAEAIARTDIPTLFWAGLQEGPSISGMQLYAAMQNVRNGRPATAAMKPGDKVTGTVQAIFGDWGHGGGLDSGVELQWYETWLRGVDTGLPTKTRTPMHVQEIGTDRWLNVPSYPMTDRTEHLFLSGTTLAGSPGADGATQIAWAPYEAGPLGSVTYAGDVLAEDTTYAGAGAVDVFVRSSNTNVQLFAEVLDVAPDGSTTTITNASILGSRHVRDPEQSWVDADGASVRPYLTLTHDEFLTPGEVVRLQIPLQPTVRSIPAGHRVAIRLATQSPQNRCVGASSIGPSPVGCLHTRPMLETLPGGVYDVLEGSAHPSVANLPLLPSDSLAVSRPGVVAGSEVLPGDW